MGTISPPSSSIFWWVVLAGWGMSCHEEGALKVVSHVFENSFRAYLELSGVNDSGGCVLLREQLRGVAFPSSPRSSVEKPSWGARSTLLV